ncbi:hypothetical protein DRW07_06795 [Alteromonas sediminis]|uniref:Lipoprotein n=1 Tax=Alteromonas sediminis TaxID=2259342 RepID=A0A3N5YCX2_9ALTE|nr:hypothetical protein [Alteromonas sediminis]RPJ67235.1 hypothetical protein DRW07_06795 [Alteromonas sediminis]
MIAPFLKPSLAITLLALTACQKTPETLSTLINNNDVTTAVEQARKSGDYKILVANMRGQVAPGLTHEEMQTALQVCGSVTLTEFSDVKTPDNREYVARALAFAKEYNKHIYALCLKKNAL